MNRKILLLLGVFALILGGCFQAAVKEGDVIGLIDDPAGGDVGGLIVSVAGKTETTGPNGTFELKSIPHGSHDLIVSRGSDEIQRVAITVTGKTSVFTIRLGSPPSRVKLARQSRI